MGRVPAGLLSIVIRDRTYRSARRHSLLSQDRWNSPQQAIVCLRTVASHAVEKELDQWRKGVVYDGTDRQWAGKPEGTSYSKYLSRIEGCCTTTSMILPLSSVTSIFLSKPGCIDLPHNAQSFACTWSKKPKRARLLAETSSLAPQKEKGAQSCLHRGKRVHYGSLYTIGT